MKIETAIFGEVNSGHALRAASADIDFARSISGRFDLPSTPPGGVRWSPAISGFPAHGRYVLARTFLDTKAPRGNMVLAHALFGSLDDMQNFGSLATLIGRLAATADRIPAVTSLEVEDSEEQVSATELAALAALVVDRGRKPVVLLDDSDVLGLVAALWQKLWPSMRRGFAFRLSFGPEDLFESPIPTVVYTPSSLTARWRGFPILGQAAAPASAAARILSGEEGGEAVMRLATDIGHHSANLASFAHLVHAQTLLAGPARLDALAAAMRLVNLLSSDPVEGRSSKGRIVAATVTAIADADAAGIMQFRNLSLDGFADLTPVWTAITGWMAKRELRAGEIPDLLQMILASQDERQAVAQWRAAVASGARELARSRAKPFAAAVWTGLHGDATSIEQLLAPMSAQRAEALLLSAMPRSIGPEAPVLLAAWSRRGWLTLHGATLCAHTDAATAVVKQLAIDTDPTFEDGLMAALSRAKPTEVIQLALHQTDERLDRLGGALMAADHALGRDLDYAVPATQRVWAAALAADPDSWHVPGNPQAAMHAALDMLLDEEDVFLPLLQALAATPLADLSPYERRSEVWVHPKSPSGLLDATAGSWIDLAAAGKSYPLDRFLENAVLSSPSLEASLEHSWSTALNLIALLNGLDEDRVTRWFDRQLPRLGRLDQQQAARLGNIILDRRWSLLLGRVVGQVHRYAELRATLRTCSAMLSVLTRWGLGISNLSREEKWEGFATVAADLYPSGPGDRDVWERAGGRPSELLVSATGAHAWRYALRLVQRGDGPRSSKLIGEMQKDFRNNPDLRFIAHDRDVVGW
ncbi:effector-associated domain EAD1-containing protein [Sphingomonas sp. M6A6_1c]